MTTLSKYIAALLLVATSSVALAQGGGPGGGGNNGNQNQPLGDAPVPNENPITEQKRVLGKILFWDEQLSSDNTVACGTCHQPAAGGADARLAANPGFDSLFGTADDIVGSPGIRALDENGMQVNDPMFGHGPQVTGRATPSFFTSMFADTNFWDGRASDRFVDPLNSNSVIINDGGALESQAVGPILNTVEMAQQGRSWNDVTTKLAAVTPLALATEIPADMVDALAGGQTYANLFSAAFGDSEITPVRIALAIATYERTLVPNQTPWDLYVSGDANAMTASQIAGWEAFDNQTPCGNCHEPPLFSDDNFRNIGLRPSLEDLGRFDVTGQNNDRGEFKTPSLRNVGLRKALMHVGWVTDTADALDFYNAGRNNTGHTQFTADQSNIPGTGIDIDEIDVFGNDPVRRAQVVDFMANGLTDPRAAAETFPFDRPVLASERIAETTNSNANLTGVATDSSTTAARFTGSVVSATGASSNNEFTGSDVLAINVTVSTDPADVGQNADFFCVVSIDGRPYTQRADGSYSYWDGTLETLSTVRSVSALSSVENVAVANGVTGVTGEFAIYVAYRVNGGDLRYNGEPVRFTVR